MSDRDTGKQNRRKRPVSERVKQRRRFFGSMLILVILVIAAVVCSIYFFKVTEIKVTEKIDKYSNAELIDACTIEEGDSIVLVSTSAAENHMLSTMPYLESCKITKNLNGTVTITVKQSNNFVAVAYQNAFVTLNSNLKVIDIISKVPKKSTIVYGLDIVKAKTGSVVTVSEDNDNSSQLSELLGYLFEYDLGGKITAINIKDKLNITLLYEGRIFIEFGTINNAEYKVKMLSEICENRLDADEQGTLDVATSGQGIYSSQDISRRVAEMKGK